MTNEQVAFYSLISIGSIAVLMSPFFAVRGVSGFLKGYIFSGLFGIAYASVLAFGGAVCVWATQFVG